MDRCVLCRSQAYFYGLQTNPVAARWLVCYNCRGVKSGTGSSDLYIFRLENGLVGSTSKQPSKGIFRTGKQIQDEVRDNER